MKLLSGRAQSTVEGTQTVKTVRFRIRLEINMSDDGLQLRFSMAFVHEQELTFGL